MKPKEIAEKYILNVSSDPKHIPLVEILRKKVVYDIEQYKDECLKEIIKEIPDKFSSAIYGGETQKEIEDFIKSKIKSK